MSSKVLVTGGAGFIGSFLVDELVRQGHQVRILDSFVHQVHQGKVPKHLNQDAEIMVGDVRDRAALKRALDGVDYVFHEAAEVGVGQSMYEISRYVDSNILGTANLLDVVVNNPEIKSRLKKIVVAASMSSYGEGLYECKTCGLVNPPLRPVDQMARKDWELHCPRCNTMLKPIPTTESKLQEVNSVYAITKKTQEDLVHNVGSAYNIPTVALRYFNVYGPRQSLSNPYTGVAAIFMSRLKNNQAPVVFEDGNQSRDFISVHDIVQANLLAMESDKANYQSFNVASGKVTSIGEVGEILAAVTGKQISPQVTHQFRKGDVRHCFADIGKIKSSLGFKPNVSFQDGMQELVEWSHSTEARDMVSQATLELKSKGLLH